MAVSRRPRGGGTRYAARSSKFSTPANKSTIDIQFEVPNIDFTDGYSQSAKPIILMLMEIAEEEELNMKLVCPNTVRPNINRSDEETKKLLSILTPLKDNSNVKVFFRYHPPPVVRRMEQRYICMTMFETDIVPPSWRPTMEEAHLIINPTEWGTEIFKKFVSPPVINIPLPVNAQFYRQRLPHKLLKQSNDKFRFITVGNYFFPDRKRLLELVTAFSERFSGKDCELYVKTTVMDGPPRTPDIKEHCGKYENVILDVAGLTTKDLIDIYCTAHAGLFPAVGEGFGMPHAELTLLGIPLVVADNTALSTMSKYMPDVTKIQCMVAYTSDYHMQGIADAGNWFRCGMDEFMDGAEKLYNEWLEDKEAYNNKILTNHRDNDLSRYISHARIKELLRLAVLGELEKCE